MIPKVIHYCWFGNNALPSKALDCIESWKKYCPDYEIKRWDETNFDCECCNYVKEAYAEKKWAFVSDYARFKILYENGGLYFDTDVEIINPIDKLIIHGAFMGCEQGKGEIYINPGLGLAAKPKMELYKKILDYYKKENFLRNDGTTDTKTVCTRVTEILCKDGFIGSGKVEYVDNIYIYPPEYFCPKNFYTGKIQLTKNTVSIHHYDATWYEPEEKKSYEIEQCINNKLGIKLGTFINFPIHYYYRFKLRMRQEGGLINAFRYFINKINFMNVKDKYRKILRYRLNRKNRKRFNGDNTISILSSNCVGGVILHELGLPFNTPTINLYFEPHDFVKFISHLKYYLSCELEEVTKANQEYPIGKLDDLTIYFVHYKTFKEAKEKWIERSKRINFEKLYIIMSDRDGCDNTDRLEFDKLPCKNKVLLTYKQRTKIESSIFLKNCEVNGELRNLCDYKHKFTGKRWIDDFDYVKFLNS